MATLLKDDAGIPIPQYQNALGEFEPSKGAEGAFNVNDAQLVNVLSSIQTIQNRVATIETKVDALKSVLGALPNDNAPTVYDLLDSIRTNVGTSNVYLDSISDALGTVGSGDPTALSILADMLTALGTLVAALASGGLFNNMSSDVSDIKTATESIDNKTSP